MMFDTQDLQTLEQLKLKWGRSWDFHSRGSDSWNSDIRIANDVWLSAVYEDGGDGVTNAATGPDRVVVGYRLENVAEVSAIIMSSENLRGEIPSEIGNLRNLVYLNLSSNQLTGAIPPSIGNLPWLETLDLHSNELTGAIPPSIGNLRKLWYLILSGNQLTGAIPPEVGNLGNLGYLNLSGNQLTAIPPEVGNLGNLGYLNLSGNQLTGAIPPWIGNLRNLTHLNLSGNKLTDAIPPEIGNLGILRGLNLSVNQLTGAIPPSIGNLPWLETLDLHSNELTGAIPPEIGNMRNINDIFLSDNKLDGDIPETFRNFLIPTSNHAGMVVHVNGNNLNLSESGRNTMVDLENMFGPYRIKWLPDYEVRVKRLAQGSAAIEMSSMEEAAKLKSGLSRSFLASQPMLGQGVVADGVAPVLLHLKRRHVNAEKSVDLQFSGSVVTGDGEGPASSSVVTSRVRVMDANGDWTEPGSTLQVTFPVGEEDAFAYIEGMPSEVVRAESKLLFRVNAMDGTTELATNSFSVARPPVALVHGYASSNETWSQRFKNTFALARPDFVFPVEYGVSRYLRKVPIPDDPMGNHLEIPTLDGSANRDLPLEANAYLLHQALKAKMENPDVAPLKAWYYLRYDVVAHSQGGVLARMLSRDGNYSGIPPYWGDSYPRGRFHRVITIGSPHNGSVIPYYASQLASTDFALVPAILTAKGLLQPKFNPFGSELRTLNSQAVDARAKFNCIRTTVDLDGFVCREHLAMGIGPGRKSVLLPFGSDAVVDLTSQAGGDGTKSTTILSENIAHSDDFIGLTSAQTQSATVAQRVVELLEGPDSNFGRYYRPNNLSDERKRAIDEIIPTSCVTGLGLISIFVPPSGFSTKSLPGAGTYYFQATAAPGDTAVDGFVWSVSVYGPEGISQTGVSVTPSPQDSSKVTVTVGPAVVGEVVLHVSYTGNSGQLVISKPQRVASIPPGPSITSVELRPKVSVLRVGESLLLEVWATYSNGITSRLFVADNAGFAFSSSAPGILAVDASGIVTAAANGMAAVQVGYQGMSSEARLQVSSEAANGVLVVNASGGSVSRSPDKVLYEPGDIVTLTAHPDEGYNFLGWSGDASGATNNLVVTMDASREITAKFARPLTLSVSGSGGSVNVESPKATYYEGDYVTLHAVPEPGNAFSQWSGDASGNANPYVVYMDANKSITANFLPIQRSLYLAATNGQIAADPVKNFYDNGETVFLTATAAEGFDFAGWSGDAGGTNNPLSVVMDSNKSITAMFAARPRSLTLVATNGTITPTPAKDFYDHGESVMLAAAPAPGFEFTEWLGALSGPTNPATVEMVADLEVVAKFDPVWTSSSLGPSGLVFNRTDVERWFLQSEQVPAGSPVAARSGNKAPFSTSYMETTVEGPGTLTYWRKVSSEYNGDFLRVSLNNDDLAAWSGEQDWEEILMSIPAGAHTVRWSYSKDGVAESGLDAAFVALVSYEPESRSLTLVATNGTITPTPAKDFYDHGESVMLAAAPAPGFEFTEWLGALSGPTNPATVEMVADLEVVAKFDPVWTSSSLGPSGLVFNRTDVGRWFLQSEQVPAGSPMAARSGNVAPSTTSYMETTVNGPGTLTYWRKVSSDEGYDFLRVSLDNDETAAWSGEQDWAQVSMAIPDGSHTVRWTYSKDELFDIGLDAAFVAQVSYAPQSSFNSWSVLSLLPSDRRGPTHRNGPMNLPNLAAHAMGLNPLTATPADMPRVTGVQSNTATFLFRRAKGLSGVTLGVKGTTNLVTGPWSAADLLNTSTSDRDGYEQVEVTVPKPTGGRYFLRLEATSP